MSINFPLPNQVQLSKTYQQPRPSLGGLSPTVAQKPHDETPISLGMAHNTLHSLVPLTFNKESLQKAVQQYEINPDPGYTSATKTGWAKLADSLRPKPDPNMQKFHRLYNLYAHAIHVCGDSLRPLISEEDMQQKLEAKTVDTKTLESYENTILKTVNNFLNPMLAEAESRSDAASASD